MHVLKSLVLTLGLLIVSHAKAGFITTDEAALDAIFSQSSFANIPIDIRIGASSELVFPNLLDITTDAEVNQLFNLILVELISLTFILLTLSTPVVDLTLALLAVANFPVMILLLNQFLPLAVLVVKY